MDDKLIAEYSALCALKTSGQHEADLAAAVERLLRENAALRARAVPEVVWPEDPKGSANVGVFELEAVRICNADHDWRWYIYPGEETEEIGCGDADSLEDARRDCVAAFLRLIGCAS